MPIAAGILGGGALSAAGGIGSALIGSGASQKASQQQTMMGLLGLQQQQQMFNTAKAAISPYSDAGASVLPTLQSLLTPGKSQTDTLSKLPGFQFASQWGNLATTNALAAQGLGGSAGPLAKGISDYNNGLAQTYWGQDAGALQNFANMGSSAAGALGGVASNCGNRLGNTIQGLGQSQAAGTLGSANALSSGLQGATGALGNAGMIYGLSGLYGKNTPAASTVSY